MKPNSGGALERFELTHKDLNSQSTKALNKELSQAKAVPYYENGKLAGYKTFEIKKESLFEILAFKNGDVVQRWNGKPINEPGALFEMMIGIKAGDRVDVIRNGKKETIRFPKNRKVNLTPDNSP